MSRETFDISGIFICQVGAYGGNLKFKLFFKPLSNGTLITSQPKVILKVDMGMKKEMICTEVIIK